MTTATAPTVKGTAHRDAAIVNAMPGLTYWSPGPVARSAWALREDGTAVVVSLTDRALSNRTRVRSQELQTAIRAGATPYYVAGGIVVGLEYVRATEPQTMSEQLPGKWTSRKYTPGEVVVTHVSTSERVRVPFATTGGPFSHTDGKVHTSPVWTPVSTTTATAVAA